MSTQDKPFGEYLLDFITDQRGAQSFDEYLRTFGPGTASPDAGAALPDDLEPASDTGGNRPRPVLGQNIRVTTGADIDLSVEPPPNSVLLMQSETGSGYLYTYRRNVEGVWLVPGIDANYDWREMKSHVLIHRVPLVLMTSQKPAF